MHLVAVVFLSLLNAAQQSRQRLALHLHGASASSTLDKVLLPEGQYEGGKCMDGTQAGYYYGPPSSGNSTLWVIFLVGGGRCDSEQQCYYWARGPVEPGSSGGTKGSSAGWEAQIIGEDQLSSDADKNPDFHDAHHVFVPYCTGDSHLGLVSNPTVADHWGYYFDGHLNVKAIAEDLVANNPAAASMQRVLFQGHSAGGRGVFQNCDFLQDQLGASVSVMCNPKSHWVPGNIQDGANPNFLPTPFEFWSVGSLAPDGPPPPRREEYRHPDCEAAFGGTSGGGLAELCDSMHVMYQYIKAPVYAIQDMFDPVVLKNVKGDVSLEEVELTPKGREYVAYVGNCTKSSMTQMTNHPQGKEGDGYFLPACYNHALGSTELLEGFSKSQGLGDWFFGRTSAGSAPRVLIAACGSMPPYLPCTPGCEHLPPVPAPTPAPEPTPDVGPGCEATLRSICGDAICTNAWFQCAKNKKNHKALGGAGCTQSFVETLCGLTSLVATKHG